MIKTRSIKKDLIITLFLLISLVLAAIRLADFFYIKHHKKEELDANLAKSAKLIFALIKHDVFTKRDLESSSNIKAALHQKIYHRYEYKIHAQAWKDGELIYNSDEFTPTPKPDFEGFRDIKIDDEIWRGFSFYDAKSRLTVLVMESDFITNQMIFETVLSLLIPLLASFLLLIFIIVGVVNKKLKPFQNLAHEIEKMSADALKQFQNSHLPIELKPFIDSFNSLMARLSDSINSERNFTNYAAHELKTPLAAIGIQAHLLINNKNKEKEQEYIQDLLNGINRATHLINQLLILSRLEADSLNLNKEKCDLAELVILVSKNYLQKARDKNLEIELKIPEGQKFFIIGNKTYLEIVISNLVDNAIKYSYRDHKITIKISHKNDKIDVKISNFGDHILKEEIDKIFNNFYRINRLEAKNPNLGCGLGLAIAKKIADLHHAEISFVSKKNINSAKISLTPS